MGENGKQAKERVVRAVEEHLRSCKNLPLFHGQINVKQLAKDSGVQRKNLYDNEEVIRLVNRKAERQGIAPLLLPHERDENAGSHRGADSGVSAKPFEVKVLERQISSLEKRITALNNQVRDLTCENHDLTSENHRLQAEVKRLKRQQLLDDMALQGRPVRDTLRQPLQ